MCSRRASRFRCGDFSLNLLMDVDGRLDRDKATMLNCIQHFLNLNADQQQEPDGFNKAIRTLIFRQLPQPPDGCWPTLKPLPADG